MQPVFNGRSNDIQVGLFDVDTKNTIGFIHAEIFDRLAAVHWLFDRMRALFKLAPMQQCVGLGHAHGHGAGPARQRLGCGQILALVPLQRRAALFQ